MVENSKVFSMTGYGRGEVESDQARFLTEIRSVNHRFLDIVVRLPAGWLSVEESVRKIVKQYVRRGRVDVFITVEGSMGPNRKVDVDWKLVEGYLHSTQQIKEKLGMKGDLTLSDLIQLPHIWSIEEEMWNLDQFESTLLSSVEQACQTLFRMRQQEGAHLRQDLIHRLYILEDLVDQLLQLAPQVASHYRERLQERLHDILDDISGIEDRLLTEVAIFAEKADITEELTRLKSHLHQFLQALDSDSPVGRRLDFLLQEMNREVNTIGSKANHSSISRLVVECKSELEKMKEQVQNIE
jgi:uncharacterized protein (TIGR00255 family)